MSNHLSNPSEHDDIIALLPWFVNQTLEADQRSMVSNHIENCDECRREIQFLTSLSESVQDDAGNSHTMHADVDKSLASVMDRIDAQSQQGNQVTSLGSWLQQKLNKIFQFTTELSFPQQSITALAGLLVAVLGFQMYTGQVDNDYSVLSASDIENPVMRLSVEMSPAADQEQIQSLIQNEIEELGQAFDLEAGSNDTYVIVFNSPVTVAELSKLVSALENKSQIEHVEILP